MAATETAASSTFEQTISKLRAELENRTAERDEALAREAAVADMLQIINSSPGDLAPVFDAMLEKAMRLCKAAFGVMRSFDGENFNTVAASGLPDAYAAYLRDNPRFSPTGTALARLVAGEQLFHIADATTAPGYDAPMMRALIELGGARTALAVPLRQDGVLLGTLTLYRERAAYH